MDIMRLYQLKLLINEPTKVTLTSTTLIILIYTHINTNIVKSDGLITGLHGHRLVYCIRRTHKQKTEPK